MASGCSAAVAHMLWEHEVEGSIPSTPTSSPRTGSAILGRLKGPHLGIARRKGRIGTLTGREAASIVSALRHQSMAIGTPAAHHVRARSEKAPMRTSLG